MFWDRFGWQTPRRENNPQRRLSKRLACQSGACLGATPALSVNPIATGGRTDRRYGNSGLVRFFLLGAFSEKDDLDSFEQDLQIEDG
jgi:hypothetical protein